MVKEENKNYTTHILVALLVVAAFALGSLYTRVKYLENKGNIPSPQVTQAPNQPTPKYQTFSDALKEYAERIGVNGDKLVSCVDSAEKRSIVDAHLKEGEVLGVQGTPGFFINGRFVGGAFPYETFKEIIDRELAGSGSSDYKAYSETLQNAYENSKAFNPEPKKVEVGTAAVRGGDGAKVTIVEFSDFQCPFCARSYPTMKKVLEDYAGKVRLVYKHFPLNAIHPHAQKAAEASECAKDQGKFWEFHDILFENQTEWANI